MKRNDKVCIGMVNNNTIDSLLVVDLIHIARHPGQHFDNMVQVGNVGLTTRSRNIVVKTFLDQTDAEWLLMIDSDERLSIDTWLKLIDTAHDKERPIVSGLVFAALFNENDELSPVPTIYNQLPGGLLPIHDYPENAIIEVDAVGTGCLLIHRKVLLDVQKNATAHQGEKWAWFVEGAIDGVYFGEDLLFSKRLKSLGYKIHVNTGAILPHHKSFWLDQRHHAPRREAELLKGRSVVPLATDLPPTSKE